MCEYDGSYQCTQKAQRSTELCMFIWLFGITFITPHESAFIAILACFSRKNSTPEDNVRGRVN